MTLQVKYYDLWALCEEVMYLWSSKDKQDALEILYIF